MNFKNFLFRFFLIVYNFLFNSFDSKNLFLLYWACMKWKLLISLKSRKLWQASSIFEILNSLNFLTKKLKKNWKLHRICSTLIFQSTIFSYNYHRRWYWKKICQTNCLGILRKKKVCWFLCGEQRKTSIKFMKKSWVKREIFNCSIFTRFFSVYNIRIEFSFFE